MPMRLMGVVLVLAAMASCSGPKPIGPPITETVELATLDFAGRLWEPFLPDATTGQPVTIEAILTVPAAPEPPPVVVIAHGCGGPGAAERDWAADLASSGIASISLDSFGRRNVTEVCSGHQTVSVASMIVDVYRAAGALLERPEVDASRMVVLGFSFGGRTALWSALTRFQEAYGGSPFDAYVAFYPSTCFIHLEHESDVAGGPIRIFHGTEDNWTPIEPCQDYVARLAADGVDADLFAYPGAHHSFDNRSLAWAELLVEPSLLSPRVCSFVESDGRIIDPTTGGIAGIDSPCVERGVSFAYDAESRVQAHDDLMSFLAAVFELD